MSPRRLGVVAYALCTAALIDWCSRLDFARQGDGWEYLVVLEAFDRHASPDVRPDDLAALFERIDSWRLAAPQPPGTGALRSVSDLYAGELPHRFVTAADGRSHAVHFWMYSLFAYPAKLALRATGGQEFNALAVTNAWMFALALGVVLFLGQGPPARRIALALVLVATPVAWYVTFTGVEVFCWALVTMALVCLDRGHYAGSAVTAALAATQNPPLALLVAVPIALAVAQRHWPSAALAALGGSVAAWPAMYYGLHAGTPGFMARMNSDLGLISWSRTASLLFDLNAGLLAYVPVLLAAALVTPVRLAAQRNLQATLLGLALAGMMLAVQVQMNWNSDGRGLQRYLVWMLPILSWLVFHAWAGRARTWIVTASVVTSGAVLLVDPPGPANWLEHRALARWVMRHAPELYNPEFEVFVERSAHAEAPPLWMIQGRRDGWMSALPIAHGRRSGEVTKLLVHRDSAGRLADRFRIDQAYLPVVLAAARASARPIYVHPPPGAVWAAPGTVDGVYAPPSAAETERWMDATTAWPRLPHARP
jgi:hypothetical protein